MKKLKKINLELKKEVVSNLSNDNLNQVKGGASDVYTNVTPCCMQPISVPAYDTCVCLVSEKCTGQCIFTVDCVETVQQCVRPTIPCVETQYAGCSLIC